MCACSAVVSVFKNHMAQAAVTSTILQVYIQRGGGAPRDFPPSQSLPLPRKNDVLTNVVVLQ